MRRKNYELLFHGFSIREAAKKTGISSVSVWRHAAGERNISAESAKKYFEILGIPLSELRPDLWPPTATPTTEPESGARDG